MAVGGGGDGAVGPPCQGMARRVVHTWWDSSAVIVKSSYKLITETLITCSLYNCTMSCNRSRPSTSTVYSVKNRVYWEHLLGCPIAHCL